MKIAALALASAALAGLTQSVFAQNDADRSDRIEYGPGMHRHFQNDDGQSATAGRGRDWSDRDRRRDRDSSETRDLGRMHRWSMHGDMQGHMTPPWRMHERAGNANEAAHFRFRRGQAAIDVQCPRAESLQACVNAAGQLLDKIANVRERNAQGTTSGSGLGSEDGDPSGSQPGSLSNQQLDQSGGSRSRLGE